MVFKQTYKEVREGGKTRMKRFHEAPISIFKEVQKVTSGDYALVHLFEENKQYLEMFEKARDEGREIILDNSVFELGESFRSSDFAFWVRNFRPTWYIVPDVLNDAHATVRRFKSFIKKFPNLPGKRIGVVQCSSVDEAAWCYKMLEPDCDMVAFSFDSDFYTQQLHLKTKWHSMMMGRKYLLEGLRDSGVININKPHHLLGCALPQEFAMYKEKGWEWIYSVDTSNPVVHGLYNIRYTEEGLDVKESTKLCTLIDSIPTESQKEDIFYNIEQFRRFAE